MKIGERAPGRRVHPDPHGRLPLQPGDYGKDATGWHARPPTMPEFGEGKGNPHPLSGGLDLHKVTEHPDGTITVDPSILIEYPWGDPPQQVNWHGYLERGVWRRVKA